MFNDDVYYKPIEVKSSFKGNYVKYESNGDKDRSLSITLYFLKVEPFLYDLIDFYKAIGEWKIQLSMQVNFIADNNDDKGFFIQKVIIWKLCMVLILKILLLIFKIL